MRRSIKIMAGIRVAAALLAVVLFSLLTTKNIFNMEVSEADNMAVNALLQRAQQAETAHYKWSSNLSNSGSTVRQGRRIRRFSICGPNSSLCTRSFMSLPSMCWICMRLIRHRHKHIIGRRL